MLFPASECEFRQPVSFQVSSTFLYVVRPSGPHGHEISRLVQRGCGQRDLFDSRSVHPGMQSAPPIALRVALRLRSEAMLPPSLQAPRSRPTAVATRAVCLDPLRRTCTALMKKRTTRRPAQHSNDGEAGLPTRSWTPQSHVTPLRMITDVESAKHALAKDEAERRCRGPIHDVA